MKTKRQRFEDRLDELRDMHGANWRNVCHLDLGSDVPDTNPGMIENAEAARDIAKMQQQTAQEYLQYAKDKYAELEPFIKQITEAQAQSAQANAQRASEYADYEKNTFRPLEQSLVDDANSYDTDAKREQLASQGMADVASAYEQQRQQAISTLARYGINPSSTRFAALNAQLAQSEAGDRAGVATRSRIQAEEIGRARKYDAAALGRGLASNASTAYGVSLNAGNSAVGNSQAAVNGMSGAYGQAGSMMGGAASSYGTSSNIYGQDFNNRLQASQQDTGIGSLLGMGASLLTAGSGSVFGKMIGFADGGDVKSKSKKRRAALHVGPGGVDGPGGPVDDKVPALLSNDEYVLPADTVQAMGGKQALDTVVAKTHTPAHIQRRRAALKKE